MIESGNRGLIFNVSFGNQNMMSKLKANLDPRFTNSKTAQFSTNLRQSLKKMFSNGGDDASSKPNGNSSPTTSRTEQTIVKEHNVATNFAAMATSLNQTQNGHQNGTSSSATTNGATTKSTSTTTSLKTQTLQEKNNKIKKSVLKMGKTCSKKWKKAEKRVQKEQESALKALHKEVEKGKRIEKSNILKDLSDANAATASRANALSADTANKILESRQNKADKEAEKHAQKKLEKETPLILENKDVQLKQYHEKLYKKTIDKQINEFNRIKNKYLV
ncbi:unnamed protein product [Orchesella dallaii]|uniref:Uncharacterized protein n=1 Tax=Orchesella dallaii TaxID=48710 RepID=A0ABP1PRY8_9HEXA